MSGAWKQGRHTMQCWQRQRRGHAGCFCARYNTNLLSLTQARALVEGTAAEQSLRPMKRGIDFGRRRR